MRQATSHCIYLIEEDEMQSAYLRGAIIDTDDNCDVHYFSDGQSALESLNQSDSPKPDIILLSLSIKDMDGYDLLETIKNTPTLKRIPTIALGQSDAPDAVRKAYAKHANSYIKKVSTIGDYKKVVSCLNNLWLAARF